MAAKKGSKPRKAHESAMCETAASFRLVTPAKKAPEPPASSDDDEENSNSDSSDSEAWPSDW